MERLGETQLNQYLKGMYTGLPATGFQYEAIFKFASLGIIVLNSAGLIQSVNPFALNLFGYGETELDNQPIEVLIPKRYRSFHPEYRMRYTKGLEPRPMGCGMDLSGLTKEGTEIPVEISLANYEHEGETFILAFISDISIRKKAQKDIEKLHNELEMTVQERTKTLKRALMQLENALEKEKELGELKSRFVSMASHEFRTPLSTVLSSTYLIEKYKTTEEQPKREIHLQRIVSSVEMLTDILNDFLSLGKIEEGKILVRNSEFNLPDFINATLAEIKNYLKHGQEIMYEHQGHQSVWLDSSLLKHIIMNLISNAAKFSGDGTRIDLKTARSENGLVLSVRDQGIGISAEDQKHLMERFFRGTNAANIQGTGLGLHIVAKYADLMEGTVRCVSKLEKGTEFILHFKIPSHDNGIQENIADRG